MDSNQRAPVGLHVAVLLAASATARIDDQGGVLITISKDGIVISPSAGIFGQEVLIDKDSATFMARAAVLQLVEHALTVLRRGAPMHVPIPDKPPTGTEIQ